MKNALKSSLLIFLLFYGSAVSCNIRERVSVAGVLEKTRKIREAEDSHKAQFGHYGSMAELIEKGLIEKEFVDGVDFSYRFNLNPRRKSLLFVGRSRSSGGRFRR